MRLKDLFSKKVAQTVVAEPNPTISSHTQGGVSWVDITDPTREALSKATSDFKLHAVRIDQSIRKGQIAQMSVEDDYIFVLLYFPYLMVAENRIATSQMSVFLGKDFLVTIHESRNTQIEQVFEAFEHNAIRTDTKGDNKEGTQTAGQTLYSIIEQLLKDTTSLTQSVSKQIDDIEDNVFDDRASDAFQIGQLRQKIMRLRRTLATQKDVLEQLDKSIDTFTGEKLKRYYTLNTNTSRKLWETVEEARETIEIYKDADFTTSTEKTNQILAVLTLLFTLTIPATILGTFYGMNILLPGGIEAGSWTLLGEYTMLKLIAATSLVSALLMFLYFKTKNWF